MFVLDLYFSKMPAEDVSKEIFFFNRVMFIPKDTTSPWYSAKQAVGKNTLDMKHRRMCSLAGIQGV